MTYHADIFYKPRSIQFFAAFAILFLFAKAQNAEETCVTPKNETGRCIEVRNCPYVVERLKTSLSQSAIDDLRRFQCGFQGSQPFVCCPFQEQRSEMAMTNLVDHPNIRLLQNNSCGRFFQSRLIGGAQAYIWDYPWMVLLGYESGNRTQYYCGGTIINEKYILTAAHCITGFPDDLKLSYVRVGEYDLKTETDCETTADYTECLPPAEDYSIQETIPHPEFDKKNIKNDIGLIRLDRSINFNGERSQQICLPLDQKTTNLTNKVLSVGGWGVTRAGDSSSVLLTGTVRVMDIERCIKEYKKLVNIEPNTQMCTNPEYARRGRCVSDSGGPLMEGIPQGRVVQRGVFSFASGVCTSDTYPKVYTRVEPYIRWILDSLKP